MKTGKYFTPALVALAALAAGYFLSLEVNGFLGISFREKGPLPELGETVAPADTAQSKVMKVKLADLGGVGILPDTANWGDNYQHNVHRFEDLILPDAPYINSAAAMRIESELCEYLDTLKAFGITGIVFPGFLEFVTFSDLDSPDSIYTAADGYAARHRAMQQTFGKWFRIIKEKGMDVYLYTDMLALTPPLEKYLKKKYGGLNADSEGLWEVYKSACSEIYRLMPEVSGVLIRIGEAGSVYNKPGWDYYSTLSVKTEVAVRKMLEAMLDVAGEYDRTVIFRTWSVGVGQIGDMHTNPDTYEKVIGSVSSDHLIVSTKYCRGDYYSWLPFNPTLSTGRQRRIAEFQLRREFEGLNAFPNYMGPLYREALDQVASDNDKIEGVWLWTQEGGPLRAGPLSIYPFHGFNDVTDLNVYAMGRMVNNPSLSAEQAVRDWAAGRFGTDSVAVNTLTDVMMRSHDITRRGLYIGQFARYDVRALGLEPPPMLWIFEWDIAGGSPSVFTNIYQVAGDSVDAAISEGSEAAAEAADICRRLKDAGKSVTVNKPAWDKLTASAMYESNLFTALADLRTYLLTYYKWLDKGGADLKKQWKTAASAYRQSSSSHMAGYDGDLDFPAYNFRESDAADNIIRKTDAVLWMARMMTFLLIVASATGLIKRISFSLPFTVIALALFTSFSAPVFVVSLLILSVIYLFLSMVLSRILKKVCPTAMPGSMFIPAALFTGFLMVLISWRGPTAFWFLFWSSSAFRTGFFMLFTLFIVMAYYIWGQSLRSHTGMNALTAAAVMLTVQGALFVLAGGLTAAIGFEKVLALLNDELMLLPGGLSRILGITTHLGIPLQVPMSVMYAGTGLLAAGALLAFIITFRQREKLN